jgi:hypothetical protein
MQAPLNLKPEPTIRRVVPEVVLVCMMLPTLLWQDSVRPRKMHASHYTIQHHATTVLQSLDHTAVPSLNSKARAELRLLPEECHWHFSLLGIRHVDTADIVVVVSCASDMFKYDQVDDTR